MNRRPPLPKEYFTLTTAKPLVIFFATCIAVLCMTFFSNNLLSANHASLLFVNAAVVGTLLTTLFAIGHECGHKSYIKQYWLGHIIGFFSHTVLLIPYFSWIYSHAWHHRYTNHISKGEANVPFSSSSTFGKTLLYLQKIIPTPIFVLGVAVAVTIGTPLYLLLGIANGHNRKFSSHFFPFHNEIYHSKKQQFLVLLSIASVAFWLIIIAHIFTTEQLIYLYALPITVSYAWIGFYTFLTHSNHNVTWFDDRSFNWLKAQCQTVIRPYPRFFDLLHLHLGSGHLAHHIYPALPHHRLPEVTTTLTSALPNLVICDQTPILKAFYRVAAGCLVVSETAPAIHTFPASKIQSP